MTEIQSEIIKKIKKIDVDDSMIDCLDYYIQELLRWNRRINLTSIKSYDVAIEKHLIDSLYLSQYLDVRSRIVDMGSGAGLPGLPLAICRPDIFIYSVECVGKKVSFQNSIKRSLGLTNFTAIKSRVEQLSVIAKDLTVDFVTARAFTSLDNLINYALPALNVDGELLAMKGSREEDSIVTDPAALALKGFALMSVESYNLPISLAQRKIIRLKRIR